MIIPLYDYCHDLFSRIVDKNVVSSDFIDVDSCFRDSNDRIFKTPRIDHAERSRHLELSRSFAEYTLKSHPGDPEGLEMGQGFGIGALKNRNIPRGGEPICQQDTKIGRYIDLHMDKTLNPHRPVFEVHKIYPSFFQNIIRDIRDTP